MMEEFDSQTACFRDQACKFTMLHGKMVGRNTPTHMCIRAEVWRSRTHASSTATSGHNTRSQDPRYAGYAGGKHRRRNQGMPQHADLSLASKLAYARSSCLCKNTSTLHQTVPKEHLDVNIANCQGPCADYLRPGARFHDLARSHLRVSDD